MSFFNKKKILVTHDGSFHADDLFATATLAILFDGNIKVIRTRDLKQIESADIVYDVGGIYNPEIGRFDHHQQGGAGTRANGIPYASFGLVWKTYGEQICGGKEIADKIETKLVEPIDANDNGINIFNVTGNIAPYTIQDMLFDFRPSWKEKQDYDSCFLELIPIIKKIIVREIIKTKDELEASSIIRKAYDEASDKRVIILNGNYPWSETIDLYEEPLYVAYMKGGLWRAEAIRKEKNNYEVKKQFPESWAGKRDEEMTKETGVPDAVFCHNGRFLIVAKSKEGIMALVEKALVSN